MFTINDEEIQNHTHNGTDSDKLRFDKAIIGAPQPAIAQTSGSAGATYGATEQNLINSLVVEMEKMRQTLLKLGAIRQ